MSFQTSLESGGWSLESEVENQATIYEKIIAFTPDSRLQTPDFRSAYENSGLYIPKVQVVNAG